MTTFRSDEPIPRSAISTQRSSSEEPDTIAFEAWLEEDFLFTIEVDVSGRRSISFGSLDELMIEPIGFRDLVNEGLEDVLRWEADLREPGGIWSPGGLWTQSPGEEA